MTKKDVTAGFSLIEMLAALTIVAMLMAMLPGTLRLGKRAWQTGKGGEDSVASTTLDFVRDRLSSAVPIFFDDGSGLTAIAFHGGPQSLRFISEVDSGPRGGGLYEIAFGQDASGTPQLRLRLFRDDREGSSPDEVRDLSAGFKAINMRYFGAAEAGAAPSWQKEWMRTDRLPDLVEVSAIARKRLLGPAIVELRLRPR